MASDIMYDWENYTLQMNRLFMQDLLQQGI